MSTHMNDTENLADLVSQMDVEDADVFQEYKNLRIEACFEGRLFIIYRPSGLNPDKSHRDPEILSTLRMGAYQCDSQNGAQCRITDVMTDQTQVLTSVPTRLFNFPLFASIPPFSKLRWDARKVGDEVKRSLSYAILLKTKNRSDFYSQGNTYCETPNDFKALFPTYNLTLRFA